MAKKYNNYPDEIHFIGNASLKIYRQTSVNAGERKRLWKNMNDILNRELSRYDEMNFQKHDLCNECFVDMDELSDQLKKDYKNIENVFYETGSLGREVKIKFTDRPEILSIHFSETDKNSLAGLLKNKINYFFSLDGL